MKYQIIFCGEENNMILCANCVTSPINLINQKYDLMQWKY